jgi:energy-coupling factor transporter transmembrane protein EcfT
MLSAKQGPEVRPVNRSRLDYIRRNAGYGLALAMVFVSIWFVCILIGVVIFMNTIPGDEPVSFSLESFYHAISFPIIGGLVGPFVAFQLNESTGCLMPGGPKGDGTACSY